MVDHIRIFEYGDEFDGSPLLPCGRRGKRKEQPTRNANSTCLVAAVSPKAWSRRSSNYDQTPATYMYHEKEKLRASREVQERFTTRRIDYTKHFHSKSPHDKNSLVHCSLVSSGEVTVCPLVRGCEKISKSFPPSKVLSPKK